MRILTVIAGMLLSAAGAFIFAFYTNAFAGLAFILGLVMLISGLCILVAYIISSRVARLPDTVLVEGLVTALFGFAVLNNEVMDAMITLFFGTWLTLSGVTRISQSFAVSRYRPRDWAKVMPLALLSTMLGGIMLMPSLTSSVNSLFLAGAAFIADGLSLLVYSMYMRRHQLTEREIEARERAKARRIAKEEQRKERDRMRSMSYQEKEALREATRRQQKAEADEKRLARIQELKAIKASRKPAEERTVQFSPQETEEIRQAAAMGAAAEMQESPPKTEAPAATAAGENPGAAQASEGKAAAEKAIPSEPSWEAELGQAKENTEAEEHLPADAADSGQKASKEETPAQAGSDENGAFSPASGKEEDMRAILEKAKVPGWNRPENIPSLRAKRLDAKAETAAPPKEAEIPPLKVKAINLEKIESGIPAVVFDPVDLPKPRLEAAGGEARERTEIIEELEKEVKKDDAFTPFEALKLEDLFGDDYVPLREKDPKEATRFTQSLNLDWTKH